MTTPLSASQDSSISETTNRSIIEEVQFWIDNPSLECDSFEADGQAPEDLKRDVKHCLDLLCAGPILDGYSAETSELRFANPEVIGAGTFGIVFRAFDRTLKRNVAIKILRTTASASKSVRARFTLEGEALARCSFEGIIPVYEVGNLNGNPCLVMRWIDGPNLDKWIKSQVKPVSPRIAATLMRTIAQAIHLAHQNGILHRDIKPSNVLLSKNSNSTIEGFPFQPFVSDFGLAKELQPGLSQEVTDLSMDSPVIGTVRYMSPEQAAGKTSEVTITSDIYSLGVILYELLTLQSPFTGNTKLEIIHKIVNQSPKPAKSLVPSVPRELNAILLKCLNKDPKMRYQTAMDFSDELNRFLHGEPVLARPVGPVMTVMKWGRRNPWIATALVVIWLGIFVSSAIIFGLYRHNLRLLQAEKSALELALKSVKETYQFVAERTLLDVPSSNATKLQLHLKALSFFQQFAEQSQYDERSTHLLSIAHHYVANAYCNVPDFENHQVHRIQCLALIERLIEQHPNTAEYHFDMFMNRHESIYARYGDPREIAMSSLPPLERALALYPKNIDYRDALSACYLDCSVGCDPATARELLGKSIEIANRLVQDYPDRPLFKKNLVSAYISTGQLATSQLLPSEALEPLKTGLDIIQLVTRNQPRSIAWLDLEVRARFWLANALFHLDEFTLESEFTLFESKSRALEVVDTKFKSVLIPRAQATEQWIQYLARHNRNAQARQVFDDILTEFEAFVPTNTDRESYNDVLNLLRETGSKLETK